MKMIKFINIFSISLIFIIAEPAGMGLLYVCTKLNLIQSTIVLYLVNTSSKLTNDKSKWIQNNNALTHQNVHVVFMNFTVAFILEICNFISTFVLTRFEAYYRLLFLKWLHLLNDKIIFKIFLLHQMF